ncbi:MAG: response regulator [Planctomycetaceae bacterium]|nr:response regulator [Planctomycetaceae bacterium]
MATVSDQSNLLTELQILGSVADESLHRSKVIVVDDEPVNVKLIKKYLKEFGYSECIGITDSREAVQRILEENPSLVILDIVMPEVNGLEILRDLRADPNGKFIPVLILTASIDRKTRVRALELGATDFLGKPVDVAELAPRVRTALIAKHHQDELSTYATRLEAAVLERTAELQTSRQEVIECLARAADYRDNDTGRHVLRVGRYAGIVARHLGWDERSVQLLEQAAPLHDIGKIGIPDNILLKPGKLTPEEFSKMQEHSKIGLHILISSIASSSIAETSMELPQRTYWKQSPILEAAATIALTHHERWDGTGYPQGLAGEAIPMVGRIVSVVDVFDALSSARPYKPAFPLEKCFEILNEGRGTQFDPQVLDAFFEQRELIELTMQELADPV